MSESTSTTLHATEAGAGPSVFLLHSGGMSSRQWRKLTETLAPTHHVVAPDFLGSGENPAWPASAPFHFDDDVVAVEALVDRAIGPVHLVGHSYGGLVALRIAHRRPERVASLALYDPVAFGVLYEPPDAEGLADFVTAEKNPMFLNDEMGGSDAWFEVFVDYWNGPGSYRALPPAAREAFVRVGRKVYYEVRSLSADRTPASTYANITAPTLLLGGEKSPPAARSVVRRLGEALPNATVRTIESAGHMGPISHASVVGQAIAAHIAAAS